MRPRHMSGMLIPPSRRKRGRSSDVGKGFPFGVRSGQTDVSPLRNRVEDGHYNLYVSPVQATTTLVPRCVNATLSTSVLYWASRTSFSPPGLVSEDIGILNGP